MDYYPVTRDKKVPTTTDHQNGRPTPSTDSSSSDDDNDFELAWRPRAYYFCNKCLVTLDLPDKNNSADETDGDNSSLEANRGNDDNDNKLPSAPNKRPPTSIDDDDRPPTVERDEPQQSSADSATKYLVKRETVASKRRPEKKKQQSTTTDAKQRRRPAKVKRLLLDER